MFNVNRPTPLATHNPPQNPDASSSTSAATLPPAYSPIPNPATDHASHFVPGNVRIVGAQQHPRTLLSHVPNFLIPVLNTGIGLTALVACEKLELPMLKKAAILMAVGMALYKMSSNRVAEMERDELNALVQQEFEHQTGT